MDDIKLKNIKRRLRDLKIRAGRLDNEYWWRSHSAILATRGQNRAVMVALTDTWCLNKGHGGYGTDPAKENDTTRHILGTSPSFISKLVNDIYELYPELKMEEEAP